LPSNEFRPLRISKPGFYTLHCSSTTLETLKVARGYHIATSLFGLKNDKGRRTVARGSLASGKLIELLAHCHKPLLEQTEHR
jgi:hypothetical protein